MSYEEEIDLLRNEIFEFRKGEDTRIVISELMARIDVQADRIAELEVQVAALKKIAVEEVAIRIAYENNMSPVECREYSHCQARRRLSEKHPEAFK